MSEHAAAEGHAVGSTKLFIWVWIWLAVITGVEVYLAYIHLPAHIMLTLLVGLSIVKAALIMAYFMHLRFERLSLTLLLVPALMFCILMMTIIFPDGFRLKNFREHAPPAAAQTSSK
jgi:cytochrome c oxidase subunit 4